MGSFWEQEATVLQRCRKGSKEAFEAVVKRYMKDSYFIALGLVGNKEDALDLSQEAFIRAYSNIKHFNPEWGFFPWFYQILRNICFSHLRKIRTEQAYTVEQVEKRERATGSGNRFEPDMLAERNETKERIWKAIGKLGEKHREVIILRHFQQLSYEQIARNLFCSKGTVMSRLYYAREKLKDMLDSQKGGQ